jgi:hypothetical protein
MALPLGYLHSADTWEIGKKAHRAELNPGHWNSRLSGMKFGNVTQWVIPIENRESPT